MPSIRILILKRPKALKNFIDTKSFCSKKQSKKNVCLDIPFKNVKIITK